MTPKSKGLVSRLDVTSCHAPKSSILLDTYSSLVSLVFLFNLHSRIFSGVWKEASTGANTFGEVRNFRKKKSKISITPYITHNAHILFSLSYVRPRSSHSSWIESLWQKCGKSHSHSLVSGNSRSRISPNALGESIQSALQTDVTYFIENSTCYVKWFVTVTCYMSVQTFSIHNFSVTF